MPRDLGVPGRELDGVHFAMDYLYQRNRWVAARSGPSRTSRSAPERVITAADKHVIVIGGGDTGADCVANSLREGPKSVTQLELLPQPPERRPDDLTPWPQWPLKLRKSYAREEGEAIEVMDVGFSMGTTHFEGEDGRVVRLHGEQVEPAPPFAPVDGTEFSMRRRPRAAGDGLPASRSRRGSSSSSASTSTSAATSRPAAYASSVEGVFAAGDARRGQSLIVWAINEGRQCARVVDRYLSGLNGQVPAGALPGSAPQ